MRRNLKSLYFVGTFLLGSALFAQVTGTVNDGNGFPESDVEVSVKGTDKVVYTDMDGNFDIDAKVGDTLIVNGKEVVVTSANLGVVSTGSGNVELEEVVITSIFDAPVKSGVTSISGESIKEFQPSVSIDQMLGGKVSGLVSQAQSGAPGSTANVNIRGAMGLNGGVKSPLYVVDGTYMTAADVNSINPLDIQDVKVLKEGAQVAVYGARGANGVVIITTKRAKKGAAVISYAGRVGFNSMMDLPNIEMMNSNQLLNFQNELSQYGLGQARTPEEIAELSKKNTNWKDASYKNGIVTSNYFSISNNEGSLSQNFSIGHDKNSGAVEYYDGFERITSSYSFNSEIGEKFRYGANVNGVYQTLDSPRDRFNAQSVFNSVLENTPWSDVYIYDTDGNIMYNDSGYPVFNVNNGSGYPTLDEMSKAYNEVRQFKLYGSGFLEMDIFKNVRARTSFGATYVRRQQEIFNRNDTYLAEILGSPNSKTDDNRDNLDYNWRNEITYSNSWDKHNLSVTVASEYNRDNRYRTAIVGRNFPGNTLITQDLAQEILGGGSTFTRRHEIVRYGYLGALSYNFDRKYMLDAYVRRDGSSLASWGTQYGTFWGVSLAWDIAREEFLKGNQMVNSLILKASYGEVGDDSSLQIYSNLDLIDLGFYNNEFAGTTSFNFATPGTTWETNRKLNLGLDFAMFNRRLSGSFAYFKDTRSDFLFTKNYSPTMGSYRSTINAGELETQGVEFDINYDIIRSKNFDISVYGNITNVNYKVTDLDGTDELVVAGAFENMRHIKGETPYQYYLVRYHGVNSETGKYEYLDADGNITDEYNAGDAVATGKSPFPKMFGGFGLNARIYGFDINADFTYSAGSYSYNNVYQWLTDPNGLTNKVLEANDYWRNPGDNAQFALPDGIGTRYSTKYLEKNDYILFRSLSVGYNFDNIIQNTPVKALRLFVQAQNLAIFTKFHGNPVQGTGSSESSQVTQAGYVSNSFTGFGYPMVRTYSLGLNVSF